MKPGNVFIGNFYAIFGHPLGAKLLEWVNFVPNDGLIHFRCVLGSEYLITTNPTSLADVLSIGHMILKKPLPFDNIQNDSSEKV
jgi:hypothetical protein